MSSKHLVEKDQLAFFHGDPAIFTLSSENLGPMRENYVSIMKAMGGKRGESITLTKKTVPGPQNSPEVNVLIYRPKDAPEDRPGILHIHGGGFVMGSAEMNEGFCSRLAEDLNSIVVSVDYRLAPETRFPGALEDCYAALSWMWNNSKSIGVDRNRLAITGESAGGALAAQLAFLVRDRKELSVVLQFLTYPMLDNRTGSTSDPGPFAGEFIWTRGSNKFAWNSLLDQSMNSKSEAYPSVPAKIENLKDLPPVYIAVGALDLLAKESMEYAQRLIEQGVPTELHLFPGAIHGFDGAAGTNLSQQFLNERKRIFQKAFNELTSKT